MKIAYKKRRFSDRTLSIIETANEIIETYEAQGFSLTLRQLYYQFVQRNLLPNTEESYGNLGKTISEARMAGLIAWTAIEDRNRNLMGLKIEKSPRSALSRLIEGYHTDKWDTQRLRPEIWVEKAALEGVIAGICDDLQVNYFSCRGYNSQSEQWRAAQRFASYVQMGQTPVVFHMGDHDPSGLDMTRDNRERLSMFAGVPIALERIALNWDQIQRYNPPPNPAKITDARIKAYREMYGDNSWELDSLEPTILRDLVEKAVMSVREEGPWAEAVAAEEKQKASLRDLLPLA